MQDRGIAQRARYPPFGHGFILQRTFFNGNSTAVSFVRGRKTPGPCTCLLQITGKILRFVLRHAHIKRTVEHRRTSIIARKNKLIHRILVSRVFKTVVYGASSIRPCGESHDLGCIQETIVLGWAFSAFPGIFKY